MYGRIAVPSRLISSSAKSPIRTYRRTSHNVRHRVHSLSSIAHMVLSGIESSGLKLRLWY